MITSPLLPWFFRIIRLRNFSWQAIDRQWLTGIFIYCNTYEHHFPRPKVGKKAKKARPAV